MPRRPRARRFLLAFAGGLAATWILCGAALATWDAGFSARVLPGVHLGAVDLSGLSLAAAAKAIGAAADVGSGELVLRTAGGDITIPYSAFGRRLDSPALADEALSMGRTGNVAERALAEVSQALRGAALEPRVAFDEASLAATIEAALLALDRAPVGATLAIGPDGPVATPAQDGWTFDPRPAIAAAEVIAGQIDAPARAVIVVESAVATAVPGDLAASIAEAKAVRILHDVVVTDGKSSWTIPAATVATWVSFAATADGQVEPTVNDSRIPPVLSAAAKGTARAPVDAWFLTTRSGAVFGAAASQDGRRLDIPATAARIVVELASRRDGGQPEPVTAAILPVAPKVTTEQARATAPLMVRLGSWTTWFPISDRNFYGANIWRPAQIINGTVLAPGQRFEWWRAVGPVTTTRGFGPGGVIKSGHTDPTGALGGGMCSSSTTLFNAALRAGLQINARANHSYSITRYPLGLDATVSIMGGRVQTMSFSNDTAHPILIRGIRINGSGGRGYVRYEIWGVPDGRTVTLGAPIVTNLRRATTKIAYVNTLAHGVRNQVEYPSNGMDVSVTRVVRDDAGRVLHNETFRSHYLLWNGDIEVGL